MYRYHGTKTNLDRLEEGRCRCSSTGTVYPLAALVQGGLILDPNTGSPLRTPMVGHSRDDNPPLGDSKWARFIYAVSQRFEIHVAPDGHRPTEGSVKHETLFHNEDVLAAGELWIDDGVVQDLNDFSGSYKTDGGFEANAEFRKAIHTAIERLGIPVSPTLLERLQNGGQ